MRMRLAIGLAFWALLLAATPASAQGPMSKYQLCVTSDQPMLYVRVAEYLVSTLGGTGRRCVDRPIAEFGPVWAGHQFGNYISCGVEVPQSNLATIELQYRSVFSGGSLTVSCSP